MHGHGPERDLLFVAEVGVLCELCRGLVHAPVCAEDGFTYCRSCITEWFGSLNPVQEPAKAVAHAKPLDEKRPDRPPPDLLPLMSPVTGQVLRSQALRPNFAVEEINKALLLKVKEKRKLKADQRVLVASMQALCSERKDVRAAALARRLDLRQAQLQLLRLRQDVESLQLKMDHHAQASLMVKPSTEYPQEAIGDFEIAIEDRITMLSRARVEGTGLQEVVQSKSQVIQTCARMVDATMTHRYHQGLGARNKKDAAERTFELAKVEESKVMGKAELQGRQLMLIRCAVNREAQNFESVLHRLKHSEIREAEEVEQLQEKDYEMHKLNLELEYYIERDGINAFEDADKDAGILLPGHPLRSSELSGDIRLKLAETEVSILRATEARQEGSAKAILAAQQMNPRAHTDDTRVLDRLGLHSDANEARELSRLRTDRDARHAFVQQLEVQVDKERTKARPRRLLSRTLREELQELKTEEHTRELERARKYRTLQSEVARVRSDEELCEGEYVSDMAIRAKRDADLRTERAMVTSYLVEVDAVEAAIHLLESEASSRVASDPIISELMEESVEIVALDALRESLANLLIEQKESTFSVQRRLERAKAELAAMKGPHDDAPVQHIVEQLEREDERLRRVQVAEDARRSQEISHLRRKLQDRDPLGVAASAYNRAAAKYAIPGGNLDREVSRRTQAGNDLVAAARRSDLRDLLLRLSESHAHPDQRDVNGDTALTVAALLGHTEVVRALCASGASVDLPDSKGSTALCLAASAGKTEVVRLLCSEGANKGRTDTNKCTPLYLAAVKGNVETVQLLIGLSADAGVADENGKTALLQVAAIGLIDVARLLVGVGGGDTQDASGRTPLQAACEAGHLEMVRLLVHWKADPARQASDGATALRLAIVGGRTDVANWLRDHLRL